MNIINSFINTIGNNFIIIMKNWDSELVGFEFKEYAKLVCLILYVVMKKQK